MLLRNRILTRATAGWLLACAAPGLLLPVAAAESSPEIAEQVSEHAPAAVRIVAPVDETRLTTLRGNTHPAARAEYDRGRVRADLPMGDLVLVLRRSAEQQAEFDSFVARLSDPDSANFHHWLTPEEVGERFGLAQADIDEIANWLRNRGLAVDEIAKDRMSIRFSGLAAQVEAAFHVEMHNLEVPAHAARLRGNALHAGQSPSQVQTEPHIANMADPQIPEALAAVVVGVKALHNFFPRPLHRLGSRVSFNAQAGGWQRIEAGAGGDKTDSSPGTGRRRATPQFGTTNSYGDPVEDVAPLDFAKIYNVAPLWSASTPIDGTGQSVAIAATSNINLADVATFRSMFGLPAKAPQVILTNSDPGACPAATSDCLDGLIENTLDVEWAGAVAKGANIILVASNTPTPTSDALYLSESYVVQHKTAPVLNVSYGSCEVALGNAGNVQYNNLWQTAAAEGIAVFVASGDSGSPACDQGFDSIDGVPYLAQFGLAVSGLASTPYNTAVGGTDFNWGSTASPYWSAANSTGDANALGYVPEVPWNESCVNPLVLPAIEADAAYLGVPGVTDAESACNFIGANSNAIYEQFGFDLDPLVDTIGGGGGASSCTTSNAGDPGTCSGGYAKPTWQARVAGIPADGHRDIPDVSFFASSGFLGSAYLICVSAGGDTCTYSANSEPVAQEVGGTSVGSPAMAGVMALINQKAGSAQGSPNVRLYALAGAQNYAACSAEHVTAAGSCYFNDIDTGTNAMPCETTTFNCDVNLASDIAGVLTGFSGSVGFDLATGLGSLNVANVVDAYNTTAGAITLTLTPGSLSFATTQVGASSAAQTVTLKNTGTAAVTIASGGIALSGTNATSFVETNTCGSSVAVGASCTITITFKPTAAGSLTASLSVKDNAAQSPQSVALTGTATAVAPTAKLSADSLTFNSTAVGATNTAPAITLSNSGGAALAISSIAFTGSGASSFSQTNSCGSSLAPGGSCGITITFKPIAAGVVSAALTVTDNAAGSPQTMAVSGTGTGGGGTAAISFSPNAYSFPSTAVGTSATSQAITVKNGGTGVLTLSSIALTGTNAASFSIVSQTCGASLAAASACTVTVGFKPVAAGSQSAALTFTDNAAASPQSVPLGGTGAGSALTVTLAPASLAFPSTAVGASSPVQTVTLKNTATAAVTVSGITLSGTDANSFVTTNTCGGSLAAGVSCTISVAFKPVVAGSLTAVLNVPDSANGSPQHVTLTGTATASGGTPAIAFSPNAYSFPSTPVGTSATSQAITVKNGGTGALTLSSIALTGTNAASFSIVSKTCAGTLAAASSCTVTVGFKPVAAGSQSASLTFTDNAAASPQSVPLGGTGTGTGTPEIAFSPNAYSFPSTAVGVAAANQAITVKNGGSGALTISSVAITGTNAASFSLVSKTCASTLAPASACTVTVGFKPVAAGSQSASLTFTDNAVASPQSLPLGGTGTGTGTAEIAFSPNAYTFANTAVGVSSATQAITVKNNGSAALAISSIALTGTNAIAFSIVSKTCAASLPAASACTVTVGFKPTAKGRLTASLTFTDNAAASPQAVPLAGTGQ